MACKPALKKTAAENESEFGAAFAALRATLAPFAGGNMRVVSDSPQYYCLETAFPVFRGKPAFFAAVRKGKAYVSYHLMPLYMDAALQKLVSPELKRRQQGKSCFNFTHSDAALFGELGALTRGGLEAFKKLAADPDFQERMKGQAGRSKAKAKR